MGVRDGDQVRHGREEMGMGAGVAGSGMEMGFRDGERGVLMEKGVRDGGWRCRDGDGGVLMEMGTTAMEMGLRDGDWVQGEGDSNREGGQEWGDGDGGGQEWGSGMVVWVGGSLCLPYASDTNHFRVFPRDAQTSQKFTDPNPTCKQKRAGGGTHCPRPSAAPGPRARPHRRHGPTGGTGAGQGPRGEGSPARAGVRGRWGRRLVLSWGTGPRLYQMPLDRPPGGARIRAEARFGTWSSI